MVPNALYNIDLAEVEDSAGAPSYARGVRYARQGAVVSMRWNSARNTLHGSVVGRGDQYETSVSFYLDDPAAPEFELGECSCPVGYNCKHVVALVLTAMNPGRRAPVPSPAPRRDPHQAGALDAHFRALMRPEARCFVRLPL